METVVPGLPQLINMFSDQNAKVREAIAWVISKICEHHAEVFASDPNTLAAVMPVFMNTIKDKPRISN